MSDWKSFNLTFPGKDLIEPVSSVLETLLIFLDILKAILDTIKTFLVDFGNPIRALVEALIALIEQLFLSLKVTGVSAYFDIPDVTKDPNFDKQFGGFQAFQERWKASLFDAKDFSRPQPVAGSMGGFIILMVDAQSPYALIDQIKELMKFFGKELSSPRYESPGNFQAVPVGQSGDPILAVASVFTDGPIESIELSWTLPTTVETPSPDFSDVVSRVGQELVPPGYVIEKSIEVNPASTRIDFSQVTNPQAAGIVEFNRETSIDPSIASSFSTLENGRVTRREILRDDQGDPLVKFQHYLKVGIPTQILGQLGRFRYLDNDVAAGKTYYYRVRPFSGTLEVEESTHQLKLNPKLESNLQLGISSNTSAKHFVWPGKGLVMGKPTGIVSATIPLEVGEFDVIEVLKRLFQTAFSLDFHQHAASDAEFNSFGEPINGTASAQVGRGSLSKQAGVLAAFESIAVLEFFAAFEKPAAAFNQVVPTTFPWQRFNVRRQSTRLADILCSAMLQNPMAVLSFRDLMQGSLPNGPIGTQGTLAGADTLEKLVLKFTPEEDAEGVPDKLATATAFEAGYGDVRLRLNVLTAIKYLKTFSLGGEPVDWFSVVPLRDIIPWSGQALYDLLDKIRGLLDAFSGVITEIETFIESIERKIDALERFIQFLLNLLEFIENLEFNISLLVVPSVSGDAFAWASEIDNAGNPPASGPGNYSAGVSFAYVAPDVTALIAAFTLIFGG